MPPIAAELKNLTFGYDHYQVITPDTGRECLSCLHEQYVGLNKYVNLKTVKFIPASENFGTFFDIDGYYIDESGVERMFSNTPDFMSQLEDNYDRSE